MAARSPVPPGMEGMEGGRREEGGGKGGRGRREGWEREKECIWICLEKCKNLVLFSYEIFYRPYVNILFPVRGE